MEVVARKNHQEKKKTILKLGGGGGAAIGAVFLLGGALATAAFVSSSTVRKKVWSSGKDRSSSRQRQNPRPETNKQDERDGTNKGQQFIVDKPSNVCKHPSGGATTDPDYDSASTESSTPDVKPRIEVNGGKPGDVCDSEAREGSLRSAISKMQEEATVSAVSVSKAENCRSSDEKSPSEPGNMIREGEFKIPSIKEDVSPEVTKETKYLEQDCTGEVREVVEVCHNQEEFKVSKAENIVEGKELKGLRSDNGETNENKCEEAIEENEDDAASIGKELGGGGSCANQEAIGTDVSLPETIISKSHDEDGQRTLLPAFDTPIVEHKIVNGNEKEGGLPTEIVEIDQEEEVKEASQEDEAKNIEEKLVEEQEKCDQPADVVVSEECAEAGWTGEAKLQNDQQMLDSKKNIPCEDEEENAWTDDPTPENRQGAPVLKHEDVEVATEVAVNKEVAETLEVDVNGASKQFAYCQPKDNEVDRERNVGKEGEEELIPENVEVMKEDIANGGVAESLEVNENETSMQFALCRPTNNEDDPERNTGIEVEEGLMSPEEVEVTEEDIANKGVAESLEVDKNKTSMQCALSQPKDNENDLGRNVGMEVEEELISPEKVEVTNQDVLHKGVAESLEVDKNKISMPFALCLPKDNEEELERNIQTEVEEELISPENVEVTKEDTANEEVAESVDEKESTTSLQSTVGQPKQHKDDFESDIADKVEDSSQTIDSGIAIAKDNPAMETSEDKNFRNEEDSSDEFKEISVGTGDSSTESKSGAFWPAESLQDPSVKLIEAEGKIQEDLAIKEHSSKHSQLSGQNSYLEVKPEEFKSQKSRESFSTVAYDSQFSDGKGSSEKTNIREYVVELAKLKGHITNQTRRAMVIGTLSLLSSLLCSWFFGLSFVELCAIVILTMALSKIHGY